MAARQFDGPFITKHNRAGKGLGVRLFHGADALETYVRSNEFEDSVDGVTLIQSYIRAPEPYITRVEFVGGEFLYAVRVDTSLGFELCRADVCEVGNEFRPVVEAQLADTSPVAAAPRFRIVRGFNHPIIERHRRFIAVNGIGVAGIEFITDAADEL